MPGKKRAEPKSSAEPSYVQALEAELRNANDNLERLEAGKPAPVSPATFSELLRIAADAGVVEFEAGPFKVKFSQSVANRWALLNRVPVDGKGRPV